jgi:hypothetical protein
LLAIPTELRREQDRAVVEVLLDRDVPGEQRNRSGRNTDERVCREGNGALEHRRVDNGPSPRVADAGGNLGGNVDCVGARQDIGAFGIGKPIGQRNDVFELVVDGGGNRARAVLDEPDIFRAIGRRKRGREAIVDRVGVADQNV